MIDTYPVPYLNLKRRIATLPPTPDSLREALKKIKELPAEYPPELLQPTRERYIAQVNKTSSPCRPSAKGLVGGTGQASE